MDELEVKKVTHDRICEFQTVIEKLPQIEVPLKHRFLDGLYSREVTMPKGSIVVSKTHNLENLTIISQGECVELTEGHEVRYLKAPCTMISEPGIKRALYMLEDTVWTTVHQNPENTRDIKELEQLYLKPDKSTLKEIEGSI